LRPNIGRVTGLPSAQHLKWSFGMADSSTELRPPSLWLMLLEGRAPWEYVATMAVMPRLSCVPRGDGHPVIVFPGLGAPERARKAAH
jgi:hypothetical protein